MGQDFNTDHYSGSEMQPKPDRTLWYMIIGLVVIILVMGYLTFYFESGSTKPESKKDAVKTQVEPSSDVLIDNQTMTDEEVRASLIKFIEVFYNDLERGYFDPPSYFPPITQTYFNFHNLTHQRIKEVHLKRIANMEGLDITWDVPSLKFERLGNDLTVTYLARAKYYKPSSNLDVSVDARYEMIINGDGKISSLRETQILNLVETPHVSTSDSSSLDVNAKAPEEKEKSSDSPSNQELQKPDVLDDTKVYDLGNIDVSPEFRGGQKALAMFLASRIKYPAKARDNKIQGKVYVTFVVEKNGSLTDFKIIKGIGSGCDEEAIRVLKTSPNWKPGSINGNAVKTSYTLPITFQLAN